jgi:Zn-dependent protease with chaperone function
MLNTSLLELLDEAELQSVIAHELGHLKCDHGVWLTVGNVLASGTMNFLPVVSSAVEEALFKWMRAAELTCDRYDFDECVPQYACVCTLNSGMPS